MSERRPSMASRHRDSVEAHRRESVANYRRGSAAANRRESIVDNAELAKLSHKAELNRNFSPLCVMTIPCQE
jgi:hypothetical protein